MLGEFDVILGRNIVIYHDDVINARMIDQFDEVLSEGGFLILGTEPASRHGYT
jgi:chemotaxis methyl-accepting protein methylase